MEETNENEIRSFLLNFLFAQFVFLSHSSSTHHSNFPLFHLTILTSFCPFSNFLYIYECTDHSFHLPFFVVLNHPFLISILSFVTSLDSIPFFHCFPLFLLPNLPKLLLPFHLSCISSSPSSQILFFLSLCLSSSQRSFLY